MQKEISHNQFHEPEKIDKIICSPRAKIVDPPGVESSILV